MASTSCELVTDTVPALWLGAGPARDKLMVPDSSAMFAAAISRLHANGSLVELIAS